MERKSWLCIRCGKINAPHVDQCTCEETGAIEISTEGVSVKANNEEIKNTLSQEIEKLLREKEKDKPEPTVVRSIPMRLEYIVPYVQSHPSTFPMDPFNKPLRVWCDSSIMYMIKE